MAAGASDSENGESTGGQSLKARLEAAYEAFSRRDVDAMLALADRDVVFDASRALAHRGVYYGHQGLRRYIEGLGETWTEFALVPDQFVVAPDGGNAMVTGTVRGRVAGASERVEAPFAHVITFDRGLIARMKVSIDAEAARRELDEEAAKPPPAA